MNSYVYNPGQAPLTVGMQVYKPKRYAVVDACAVTQLRSCKVDIQIEGDSAFEPLFAVNIPDKTPNEIL